MEPSSPPYLAGLDDADLARAYVMLLALIPEPPGNMAAADVDLKLIGVLVGLECAAHGLVVVQPKACSSPSSAVWSLYTSLR